jgi:hypothetical protein
MLGEGEGGDEFNFKDPVRFRGGDGGDWGVQLLSVMKWFCRRDARRLRLARERALPLFHYAPVMQYFRAFTIIPVYSRKRESFFDWMVMLVGKPVARLRSSANPWPG